MATRNRQRRIDRDILDEITVMTLAPGRLGGTAILRLLSDNPKFAGRLPDVQAVQRSVADIRRKATLLDGAFEYHQMEEYDLPWEAGPYILQMWAWVREGGALPFGAIGRGYFAPVPTAREATWWWRIHLVDPQLDNPSVWQVAGRFAQREWAQVFQGKPLALSDLEAFLAYRPWRSEENKKTYERAIKEGRIPGIVEERSHFVRTIIPD